MRTAAGRRALVRVLALLGVASSSLMLVLVAAEAAGLSSSSPVGSLGALALGASGLLAAPALLAAVVAGPSSDPGDRRPGLLLSALALMALPHHQAHWFAMAVLAVVLVVRAAAYGGEGWRLGTTVAGMSVVALGTASLADGDAASAAPAPFAAAVVVWGPPSWS